MRKIIKILLYLSNYCIFIEGNRNVKTKVTKELNLANQQFLKFFGSIFIFQSSNKPTSTGLNKNVLQTLLVILLSHGLCLQKSGLFGKIVIKLLKMTDLNTNDGFATARLCSLQKGPNVLKLQVHSYFYLVFLSISVISLY